MSSRPTALNKRGTKIKLDGYTFDSQKEYDFYVRFVKDCGFKYEVHPRFILQELTDIGNGKITAIRYTPDFVIYEDNGDFIAFDSLQTFSKNDKGQDIVFTNYWGIPVDPQTGYPLIKKGHELACEAYCVWKLYTEDFLTNKIDANRWMYIVGEKDRELNAAQNGFRQWDRKDLERISMIKMNMLPRVGQIPLYNLEWINHEGTVNPI